MARRGRQGGRHRRAAHRRTPRTPYASPPTARPSPPTAVHWCFVTAEVVDARGCRGARRRPPHHLRRRPAAPSPASTTAARRAPSATRPPPAPPSTARPSPSSAPAPSPGTSRSPRAADGPADGHRRPSAPPRAASGATTPAPPFAPDPPGRARPTRWPTPVTRAARTPCPPPCWTATRPPAGPTPSPSRPPPCCPPSDGARPADWVSVAWAATTRRRPRRGLLHRRRDAHPARLGRRSPSGTAAATCPVRGRGRRPGPPPPTRRPSSPSTRCAPPGCGWTLTSRSPRRDRRSGAHQHVHGARGRRLTQLPPSPPSAAMSVPSLRPQTRQLLFVHLPPQAMRLLAGLFELLAGHMGSRALAVDPPPSTVREDRPPAGYGWARGPMAAAVESDGGAGGRGRYEVRRSAAPAAAGRAAGGAAGPHRRGARHPGPGAQPAGSGAVGRPASWTCRRCCGGSSRPRWCWSTPSTARSGVIGEDRRLAAVPDRWASAEEQIAGDRSAAVRPRHPRRADPPPASRCGWRSSPSTPPRTASRPTIRRCTPSSACRSGCATRSSGTST